MIDIIIILATHSGVVFEGTESQERSMTVGMMVRRKR
jgi:hypothetical protein